MSRTRLAAARTADRLADLWRDRLTARAADASATIAGRGLLVIAPHPDDETFGCGALIARARAAGVDVTVLVASDGARCTATRTFTPAELVALRSAELHEACRRLGVTDVIELGHPDGALSGRSELAGEVADLIAARDPGVVLTPCAQDLHSDHVAAHRATVAALARVPGRPLLLSYPVWAWHAGPFFLAAPPGERLPLQRWAVRQLWSGSWWRVPADEYHAQKQHAVAAYRSQTTNLTGEPGWSHLPPSFVRNLLGPSELFLPVDPLAGGRLVQEDSREV